MSKSKKNKYSYAHSWQGTKEDYVYTKLYHSKLNSFAYSKLSYSARSTLTIIEAQYKGKENIVKCPYEYLVKHGIKKTTIPKALIELYKHGFIDIKPSPNIKIPNEYTLTSHWQEIKTQEDIDKIEHKMEGITKMEELKTYILTKAKKPPG